MIAQIRQYLEENPPMEVEVKRYNGKRVTHLLLDDKMVLISKDHKLLHVVDFVRPHQNGVRLAQDEVVILGEVFKIEHIYRLDDNPDEFMDAMMRNPLDTAQYFTIKIDGEEVFKTESLIKCNRKRNWYLKRRKLKQEFFQILTIIDPEGKRTDFTFPRT